MDTPDSRLGLIDLLVVIGLIALVFGIVGFAGNFVDTPRLTDEIQIYDLSGKASTAGFLTTAADHLDRRTFAGKRFYPLYLSHKLFCVWLYGTNLILWSIHMATMGAMALVLLYVGGRFLGLTPVFSAGVAIIVGIGEQSVVWWRLFNGENIGLMFLGFAILGLSRGIRAEGPNAWDVLFVVAAVLASACKESFILMLPALAYGRMALIRIRYGITIDRAWRRDRLIYLTLAATFVIELAFVLLVLRDSGFRNTGFQGFAVAKFVAIAWDTIGLHRAWILWATTAIAALLALANSDLGSSAVSRIRRWIYRSRHWLGLAALICVPQWLLYMSTGYDIPGHEQAHAQRYLIPGLLGVAVAAFGPLSVAHSASNSARHKTITTTMLILLVTVFGFLQTRIASADAKIFSSGTALEARYFESLVSGVEPSDPLTVVYSVRHFAKARRISIILAEYLGYRNLRFLPVTFGEPLDAYFARIEQRRKRFGDLYDRRIVGQTYPANDPIHAESKSILVLHHARIYDGFRVPAAPWFSEDCYESRRVNFDDIVILRPSTDSNCAKPYEPIRLQSRVVFEALDHEGDLYTLRGYAVASRQIETVEFYRDDVQLRDVEFGQSRGDVLHELPEFQTMYAGFSARFYADSLRNERFRVVLWGEDNTWHVDATYQVGDAFPVAVDYRDAVLD